MSSFWWTLLALIFAAFVQAESESTAHPDIPKHLLECYMDQGIYHRANRLPATFESFLDLVRKVEESPTSRNMNARELAVALLHYVKLDGIRMIPRHGTQPHYILPFAASGPEYFKHRLTLLGLVPRIDASYQRAINETLTKREMCNLHFLMSNSIDPYKRNDEKCSPLFPEPGKGTEVQPRPSWDNGHWNVGGYRERNRRHVHRGDASNALGASPNKKTSEFFSEGKTFGLEERISGHSSEPLATFDAERKQYGKLSRRRKSVTGGERNEKKSEVEEITVPRQPDGHGKHFGEEKNKFTIGDQELLSASEYRPETGRRSLVQMGTFGRYGGRARARATHSDDGSFYAGVAPGVPLSDCPVVNGIVATPFGSLAIGTVVGGIAAGLNPQDIPPVKFSVDPGELESPSDKVNNIWAMTLAGTVADIVTSFAILDNFQILKGGWNDSADPKWYLLANNQFEHLPEVNLRGSLDGLLLGVNAREWTSKFPGFKLSQMLEIYYDRLWGTVGAKNRVELRSRYAQDEVFRKQAHLMSLVLKKQKTNDLTVLNYKHISAEAVNRVIQHIQMLDDNEKSYIGSFLSTKIDNSINMIAVIDSSWGHENLLRIFQVLRAAQVAYMAGNNVTVVCGKDGRVLMSSENSVDLYDRFTKDMLFENCSRGMDFPLVFDTLEAMYRKIFYLEKMSQKMDLKSQVSILFPYEPISRENPYLEEKSRYFRSSFPDVRLMIASNGRSESFSNLVKSPADLFALVPYSSDPNSDSIHKFADGVKQSFQRIARPSCGSYFDDHSEGIETRATRDVGAGNIVYYRLSPQYFYTQHGQATVTIRSTLRAPLTVCHSRDMERPTGPTPRGSPGQDYGFNRSPDYGQDFPPEASPYGRQRELESEGRAECKTITSELYKIEMNNPCEGASNLQDCRPLYISLSAPHQETVSIICPHCRLPTNVHYEISVAGLTCYNSAATKLLSPLLLSLVSVLCFFKLSY